MPNDSIDVKPEITLEKIRAFSVFLPTWNTGVDWPSSAPLNRDELKIVSSALWMEEEITWMRILGTILYDRCQRLHVQDSAMLHFVWFPTDIERMFRYWIQSKHLKDRGMHLLQIYQAIKSQATYPALAGLIPLVETVLKRAGFPDRNYKDFFDSFSDGIGTQSAKLYTEYFYKSERDLVDESDERFPFNRHLVVHGEEVESIYPYALIGACAVLDMIVSTDATNGQPLIRILDHIQKMSTS